MTVLFLSPDFPPHFELFCRALRARGRVVVGIGEAPAGALTPTLREALADYVAVPDLTDEDALLRATASLVARHGRLRWIDSLNEHWLQVEAKLREDFNVPGLRPDDVRRLQSKEAMAEVYRGAGLDPPRGERVTSRDQVRAFAGRHGFPIVLKPDVGVGAGSALRIGDAAELEVALAGSLDGFVVQEFVPGTVTSFDGLVDAQGHVVFFVSFRYCDGVLRILTEQLDVHYYSRRVVPPELERQGRAAVAAFGLRDRFFHAEFFELPGGGFRPLEMNVRPPGGFTTDLMNYTCDFDVYDLWARVVAGESPHPLAYAWKFHVAHASRRRRPYRYGEGELRARLGPTHVLTRPIPHPLSVAMGDELHVLRHEDEAALLEAIALVHAR